MYRVAPSQIRRSGRRRAGRAEHRAGRGPANHPLHAARRSRLARPGLDHRRHHPEHSLAVYDTLYGLDATSTPQPQMVDGPRVEDDGKTWDAHAARRAEIPRRHAGAGARLRGHDQALGQARSVRRRRCWRATDEIGRVSDRSIRFRLKKPFPLLPAALARAQLRDHAGAAGQDRRQSRRSTRWSAAVRSASWPPSGSPARARCSRKIPPMCRARTARRASPPGRRSSISTASCGPSCPIPRPPRRRSQQGEIDWWENPTIDLVPPLKRNKKLVARGQGPHRRDRLPALQPVVPAVRQCRRSAASCLSAVDQNEFMQAIAGAEPSLIKTDVGLFVPGTPMASTVGVEITRGPKDSTRSRRSSPPPDTRARRW